MEIDDVDISDIRSSLSISQNRNMVFKAGEGSGQSGSFFFFSNDKRFIIKTLRGKEKRNLINMLDDMIQHFRDTDNKSFLAKIYALYTIKTNVFRPLDIIIM